MRTNLYNLFKYLAIAGNVLFILWVTYNGIDEGFRGTLGSEGVVCRLDAVAGAQYGFNFEKRESDAPFARWAPPPFSRKWGRLGGGFSCKNNLCHADMEAIQRSCTAQEN